MFQDIALTREYLASNEHVELSMALQESQIALEHAYAKYEQLTSVARHKHYLDPKAIQDITGLSRQMRQMQCIGMLAYIKQYRDELRLAIERECARLQQVLAAKNLI